MSLYLVTGGSGTGKSTLKHALVERGYVAYDTDDDALARWQHNTTGFIHPKSSVKAHMRTPDFLAEHSWNVPAQMLAELDQSDRPVFILGAMSNEQEVAHMFSKIFALYIDDDTTTQRLRDRMNNDWGKQPHELAQTLASNQGALDRYRQFSYMVIDASQPIGAVLDILEAELPRL